MDHLDFIIDVETNGFDPSNASHIEGLQSMIDSGIVWRLQGFWGRFAQRMIDAGIVKA